MDIERRVKEIFNWQEKKEREYIEIASEIIDALVAKMESSGTDRFKLPFGISKMVSLGVARCNIWDSQKFHRTAIVIEEKESYIDERAERCVTIIDDHEYGEYHKYPFRVFEEEIRNEEELSVSKFIADPGLVQDARPTMWRYLKSIPEWEPITSSQT
jgi:hypothetical protein